MTMPPPWFATTNQGLTLPLSVRHPSESVRLFFNPSEIPSEIRVGPSVDKRPDCGLFFGSDLGQFFAYVCPTGGELFPIFVPAPATSITRLNSYVSQPAHHRVQLLGLSQLSSAEHLSRKYDLRRLQCVQASLRIFGRTRLIGPNNKVCKVSHRFVPQ